MNQSKSPFFRASRLSSIFRIPFSVHGHPNRRSRLVDEQIYTPHQTRCLSRFLRWSGSLHPLPAWRGAPRPRSFFFLGDAVTRTRGIPAVPRIHVRVINSGLLALCRLRSPPSPISRTFRRFPIFQTAPIPSGVSLRSFFNVALFFPRPIPLSPASRVSIR